MQTNTPINHSFKSIPLRKETIESQGRIEFATLDHELNMNK